MLVRPAVALAVAALCAAALTIQCCSPDSGGEADRRDRPADSRPQAERDKGEKEKAAEPEEPPAESCRDGCCFGMHVGGTGTCRECDEETPFASHTLCTKCAAKGNRCLHCRKPLAAEKGPEEPVTEEPPPEPPPKEEPPKREPPPEKEPPPKPAEKCSNCCFGMHVGAEGTCDECGKKTAFASHKLCTTCAAEGGRCTHCKKPIGEPKK